VNYKTIQHEIRDEWNYATGLDVRYYDTDLDGEPDTIFMFQILTEGQGDLVYNSNDIPLFVALDLNQDGIIDVMGVYDEELGTCHLY